jgi:hypothetical protein
MKSPIRSLITVVALCAAFALSSACPKKADPNTPPATSAQQLRNDVSHVGGDLKSAFAITDVIRTAVNASPLTVAQKDDIDHAISAATGTHEKQGPLAKAIDAIVAVNDAASLKALIPPVLDTVQPLIQKLQDSKNTILSQLGTALFVALTYERVTYGAGS